MTIAFSVSTRLHRPLDIVRAFEELGRVHQLRRVYGFLFDSPLNGGRHRSDCVTFPMEVIGDLNARGIGYYFTLNNPVVAREFLEDPLTNRILAAYENPLNGVIVADDRLADFVRRRYPRYRLQASCIYNFLTPDEINAATERFDEVCVFPEVNLKPDVLDAIKRKEKMALFGTSVCLNLCGPDRRHHYYILGQDHIAWYNHRVYGVPYHPDTYKVPRMPWCRASLSSPMVHDIDGLAARGFSLFKITQFELFRKVFFLHEDPGTLSQPKTAWHRSLVWARIRQRLLGLRRWDR